MGNQSNMHACRSRHVRSWLGVVGALVILASGCGPGSGSGEPRPVGSLEIEVMASGAGSVEAPAFGFSCRDTCILAVEAGDRVTLIAVPDDGQLAVAWDGPCDALDENCEWRVEQGARVQMHFAPNALRLALEGDGEGRFEVSDGTTTTNCRASCGVGFDQSRMVAITYRSEGSARTVVGPWSGACSGATRDDYCLLRVEDAVEVGTTWLHPPLARDVAYVTDQEQPLQVTAADGVLANDEDSPGDPLSAQLLSGPDGGTLALAADGSFRYEPTAGFAGVDSFVYRARDAYGNEDDARVRITVRPRLQLSKAGDGAGRISSEPPGIDCGSSCTSDRMHVEPGTSVTLTATPDPESLFSGWGGDCSGTGACVITIDGPTSVSATFALADPGLGTLSVTLAGTGVGRVSSDPPGIDVASGTSSAQFELDSTVELTATPDPGSTFAGWSGDCRGTSTTCTVTMSESVSVTATFTRGRRTLTVAALGDGNVTSDPAGIDLAAGEAKHDFGVGTSVALTADPAEGYRFSHWSGACSGTSSTCTVAMTEDRSVTATFEVVFHTLSAAIDGDGNGVVTSSPRGIDFDHEDGSASADFAHGTSVTLTALATAGSTFAGWSGDCSGTDDCTLVMTEDHSATATFDPDTACVFEDVAFADDFVVPADGECSFTNVRIGGDLVIERSARVISLGGAVEGNVLVHRGARYEAVGTSVGANIEAERASVVELVDASVGGNLQAERTTRVTMVGGTVDGDIQSEEGDVVLVEDVRVGGNVQLDDGARIDVLDSEVGGDIQLEKNAGPVTVRRNEVAGDVQLWDNRTVHVNNNRIGGDLQCAGNEPTPTGGGNVVEGDAEGQCSGLVR